MQWCAHNTLKRDCPDCAQQQQLKVDPLTAAFDANEPAYVRRLEAEPKRCKRCDWPLAATREEGCVEGDCSFRCGCFPNHREDCRLRKPAEPKESK